MNNRTKRILIMAGGTGGHVFPGLAVAQCLKTQGICVEWLGTQQGIEAQLVPAAGIKLNILSVTGLRGKKFNKLRALLQLIHACWQAVHIVWMFQPDLVLGMGGFASGPGGLAAWLLRKPLVIHEQNAIPGFTNRILAYLSTKILSAFLTAFKSSQRVICTGNPVRQEIQCLPAPALRFAERNGSALHVLVLGGSQGAAAINQILPKVAEILGKAFNQKIQIWHQTGARHFLATQAAYDKVNSQPWRVAPFIDEMAEAYAWADLVICRAGATTIAELIAAGLGSILIPYPHATDDHQTHNGACLVSVGAAIMIKQPQLTAEHLAQFLKQFIDSDRSELLKMAEAARSLCQANATENVASVCSELLKK